MTAEMFFWVGVPYAALAALIIGLIWRWRTDQFGWTSRSSQWHENAILRWASPLFHFGIIFVFFGHVAGMLIPKSVTAAVGVSDHMYHLGAVSMGGIAGVMTLVGALALIYRRFVIKSVRLKTTRGDIIMYVLLMIPIVLGFAATLINQVFGKPGGYDYRETIGPWIRSILVFQPQPELMMDVPLSFQLHVVAGLLLFAILPFTRLVHIVSAPVAYPTRPDIVYRSREESNALNGRVGASGNAQRDYSRGWKPVRKQSEESEDVPYVGA